MNKRLIRRIKCLILVMALLFSCFNCNTVRRVSATTTDDGFSYSELEDGTIAITGWTEGDSVTELIIPTVIDGKTVTQISNDAFYGCVELVNVELPESITYIGEYAFEECHELTSITLPNGVTSIGKHAFAYCYELKNIEIPESVVSIGEDVFEGSQLTSIVVDSNNQIYDSRDNANAIIETATNTLIVGTSATKIPESVTSIGNNAFSGCEELASIEIPESVTSIGDFAFYQCNALAGIKFSDNITSIGEQAFFNCHNLSSIEIPANLTNIGDMAFACCGLNSIEVDSGNSVYDCRDDANAIIETATNILLVGSNNTVIPNGITTISSRAFANCELDSLEIPSSVTSIGDFAFPSSINTIIVDDANLVFDSRENANAIIETATNKLLFGFGTTEIPDSVTSIGNRAFYSCGELNSLEIPLSVTSIGDEAFYWCYNLDRIKIPSAVTAIGEQAFYGCSDTLVVYADANSVAATYAADAGFTVKTLEEWGTDSSNEEETNIYETDDGWRYRIYEDEWEKYAEIVSYNGTEEVVTIPESVYIDGLNWPIYGMDAEVFSNLDNLKHIDCNGFSISSSRLPLVVNCPNLESISIPGENAFMGGTIIQGETNKKVTLKSFPDLKWSLYDDDDNFVQEMTIEAYCNENNLNYEKLPITVSNLAISNDCYKPHSGVTEYPVISYRVNGILAGGKGSDNISWSSSDETVANFDEKGMLIYGEVSKATTVTITANAKIQGEECSVSKKITVYPKLTADRDKIILSPNMTCELPECQFLEWLDLECYVTVVDIPDTYNVTYSYADGSANSVATVTEDGQVTVIGSTEGASTVITATYTDGTNTYKYDFTIEIGKTSVPPFELPSTSGNKINIYSWNYEVPDLITDEFLALYPQYKDLINVVNLGMSGTSNEYKEAIANAIESKDANSPDIVAWDIDMLPYAMEQPYTIDLTDIGFDKDWYQYAYDYVRENGMDGDTLKAVSWQGTPGCFLYRKDIAETVFGTSDADAIQEKVKDWDTFLQTAEQLKQAGYKVVSGPDDIKYNFTNIGSVPLFDNNVVNLGNQVTEYLTVAQELYENGYTNNTSMWDDAWSAGFDGDVFGYFGCTWFAYWSMNTVVHQYDYMICSGPSDYYWGGSYITATNAGHNDELVKLIMYTLSCDENFLYRHTKETNDFSSNQNVSERMMAEGKTMVDTLQNDPYPIWHKVAKKVQTHKRSQYDMILNGCVDVGMTLLCNDGDAETVTVTEALDIIEARIKEYYPTFTFNRVKIEASTPVHTHTPVVDAAVAATCTTSGKTEGSHCSTCNEVLVAQTEIPATGHTEVADAAVAATCTTLGKTEGSHCSVCNAVIKAQAVVPATGHTEVVDVAVAPTCTEAGKTEGSHCSVCNVVIKEQTAISATGHRSDKGTVKEKSTTKKHGKKVYKCTICKETLKTEKLDKLPEVEDKKADYKAVQDEDGEIHIEYDGSKKKEKEVKIPDTIKDENGKEHKVTAIADDAFKGDKKVEEIKMGKNITEIGDGAFNGCKNLEEVTIGKNVTTIGDDAFKNCKSLDKVTLPSKVKEVGDDAFNGCKDLKDVKLGKKVEELGDNAFKGCSKLTEITLPANLDELGKNIFYGCKKLKKLVIQSKGLTTKTVEKNVFKGLPKTTTIYVPKSKLKEYKSLFKKKGLNSKVIVKGK